MTSWQTKEAYEPSPLSKLPGWACLCGAQEDAAAKSVECWSCGGDMKLWRASSEAQTI